MIIVAAIGLSGGMAIGVQSPIAVAMAHRVGEASGSLILHLSGSIASLVLVLIRGGETISQWKSLPWYMYASGALGLILFLSLTQTIPRFGAAAAITLLVAGQLISGLAIDHFGLFEVAVRKIDIVRLLGVVFLFVGIILIIRPVSV